MPTYKGKVIQGLLGLGFSFDDIDAAIESHTVIINLFLYLVLLCKFDYKYTVDCWG